jgi:hypothetical protein
MERHGQEGHIGCCHNGGKSGLSRRRMTAKAPSSLDE